MIVEKTKVMRISKLPPLIQFMIDKKPIKNVEYLKNLGSLITIMQDVHVKLSPVLPR